MQVEEAGFDYKKEFHILLDKLFENEFNEENKEKMFCMVVEELGKLKETKNLPDNIEDFEYNLEGIVIFEEFLLDFLLEKFYDLNFNRGKYAMYFSWCYNTFRDDLKIISKKMFDVV